MQRTTDEMRWKGSDRGFRAEGGGQADRRTGAGQQADWWTSGRGRTVADGFSKGKTPKLKRQLTWPSEIQRGRPQVIVQLCHLPPPSW